jgi:hypothetical protein
MAPAEPKPRVLVASIPKSGTYLVIEVLRRLQIEPSYRHLDLKRCVQYDATDFEGGRRDPSRFAVAMPVAGGLRGVPAGQSVATHLPPFVFPDLRFLGFRVLWLRRDLRDVLVSHCRWARASGRAEGETWTRCAEGPEQLAGFLAAHGPSISLRIVLSAQWALFPGAMPMSFEELTRAQGAEESCEILRPLASFLGVSVLDDELAQALDSTLKTPTLTSSSARSRWREWWSDEVEGFFVDEGLDELNRRLDSLGGAPAVWHGARGSFRSRVLALSMRLPLVGVRTAARLVRLGW